MESSPLTVEQIEEIIQEYLSSMATRQYVGMRYIMKFIDAWSSADTYEPLCMVYNGEGCYISRTIVPAGTSLSDTDYWFYFPFSPQIEQLRQIVEGYSGQISQAVSGTEANTSYINREKNSVANVKDYGAVGDGKTDDTAAFQAALNAGKDVYVPASNGEIYRITQTLTLGAQMQWHKIFGDGWNLGTKCGLLFDAPSTDDDYPMLDIQTDGVRVIGLHFFTERGDNSAHNTFVKCTRTVADQDEEFYNVYVQRFATVFNFTNRGLWAHDCCFVTCGDVLVANWNSTESEDNIHGPDNGMRAIRFVNNRYHGVSKLVHLQSGNMIGFQFIGNYIDIGCNAITAESNTKNWTIADNYVRYANPYFIMLSEGHVHTGHSITGNVIAFNPKNTGTVAIYGSMDGCAITGNTILDAYSDGIQFVSIKNTAITGNYMRSVADGTQSRGFVGGTSMENCAIVGNVLTGEHIYQVRDKTVLTDCTVDNVGGIGLPANNDMYSNTRKPITTLTTVITTSEKLSGPLNAFSLGDLTMITGNVTASSTVDVGEELFNYAGVDQLPYTRYYPTSLAGIYVEHPGNSTSYKLKGQAINSGQSIAIFLAE